MPTQYFHFEQILINIRCTIDDCVSDLSGQSLMRGMITVKRISGPSWGLWIPITDSHASPGDSLWGQMTTNVLTCTSLRNIENEPIIKQSISITMTFRYFDISNHGLDESLTYFSSLLSVENDKTLWQNLRWKKILNHE